MSVHTPPFNSVRKKRLWLKQNPGVAPLTDLFLVQQPAVSIGNVGQLAVDLVISSLTLNHCRIGYFHDACILPMAGNDPFNSNDGTTGCLNIGIEG